MEKAIVTKKQAEALKTLELASWTPENVLNRRNAPIGLYKFYAERAVLDKMPVMLLAKALVNGWEVEPTPHEKLAEVYKAPPITDEHWHQHYYRKGIEAVLYILNIKVEGINDETRAQGLDS